MSAPALWAKMNVFQKREVLRRLKKATRRADELFAAQTVSSTANMDFAILPEGVRKVLESASNETGFVFPVRNRLAEKNGSPFRPKYYILTIKGT